jgi:hypothetical protein
MWEVTRIRCGERLKGNGGFEKQKPGQQRPGLFKTY